MRTEKNQELIDRFIEQLESLGLDIGSRLDQIENEKKDYHFFEELLHKLEESKIDFCSSYFELSEEEKKDYQGRLLSLFKDQEIVDNIMQEIINLYYLNEYGLLNMEETAPQREVAYENLETLATKISKYLQDINVDQLEQDDQRLSEKLEKLVSLGTTIESDEPNPLEDIDFIREVMEYITCSEEEQRQILIEIIHHNLAVYENHYQKKKDNIPVETTEIEELKDNPIISKECLEQIEELLSRKDIIEKIIKIISTEYTTTIHIRNLTPEEMEDVNESLSLVREEMIDSIEHSPSMTPEQALEEFFVKYDETTRHKNEFLQSVLENCEESTMSEQDQQKTFKKAWDYLESRRQLVADLTKAEGEMIRRYMQSLLTEPNGRKMVYDSPMYDDQQKEQMAAYEIEVYKELLEIVPEEDEETRSKIANKLDEILAYVTEEKKEEQDEKKGILFFLQGDEESLFEEDLDLNSNGKGIPSQYFSELKNQLISIKDRSERTLIASQPVNPGLKAIKKEGVRYTTGSRTKVFFIPVGKKDAIIVGTSFLSGKDVLKDQDKRIKKYQEIIALLRKRLEDPATYEEEQEIGRKKTSKILATLSPKELDEMFAEETTEEQTQKVR